MYSVYSDFCVLVLIFKVIFMIFKFLYFYAIILSTNSLSCTKLDVDYLYNYFCTLTILSLFKFD